MLKICGFTIYRPLEIIFKEPLSTGLFPSEQKKGLIPIYNKGDKQVLKNCSPVYFPRFVEKSLKD